MASKIHFEKCWSTLEKDGFLILRGFLDPLQVAKAREEIEQWISIDLEARRKNNIRKIGFMGPAGFTTLDSGKHLLIDFFAKSPALDQLYDQMLTHSVLSRITERLVGKHMKLRGYNIRAMTGDAKNSAMEWHRDNFGEINWSIILSETEAKVDGTTCFIPGSHKFPSCPFKSAIFPMPYADAKPATRFSTYSKQLAKETLKDAVDAEGKPGDCIIFLGDTWHARRPNLQGKKGMVLFVGAFPAEVKFPSNTKVIIPPIEVLEKLSPSFRKVVDYRHMPVNSDRSAYVYELAQTRQKREFFSLWHLAGLEKKIWDLRPRSLYNRFKRLIKPYVLPLIALITKHKSLV